jgi:hypothetical protein
MTICRLLPCHSGMEPGCLEDEPEAICDRAAPIGVVPGKTSWRGPRMVLRMHGRPFAELLFPDGVNGKIAYHMSRSPVLVPTLHPCGAPRSFPAPCRSRS